MAAIYDEQGNYVGDDGAPSLDQMKLELVKKNQPLSAQIPGYDRPIPQAQSKPDPLGAAAGNFTELATKFNPLMMAKSMKEAAGIVTVPAVAAVKGVGESILTSPAGTYTSGKAPDYAEQVAKQFMEQNAPQTPMTQEFAGAIAPYMAELPAYLGHLSTGRPALTPNDLRVMGAEATRVGRQVRDIPTDFVNAQSGMQRLDPITGQPTYGAKLQGVAESVGDIAAARRAEGKSLIPGIPDVVTPETSLYAVRPQGSRLIRPTVPETANIGRTWATDVLEDVNIGPMKPVDAWTIIDNTVLAQQPQRVAFRKFLEGKYAEMYPDAPSKADAKEAFETMYGTRDAKAAKVLEFYDEFLQAPEGAVVGANNLLTATEIKARHDAATQWLNNNLLNYIQKNVGTEGDPLVKAASEGLTYLPAEKYQDALQSPGGQRLVEQNRRAGNMPVEGSLAEPITKKETELAEAQSKLNEIESKRRNLADIAMKQGLPDPAMLPEYAALTNPVRSAVRERDRIEEQLDNLKIGKAYETAADYGVVPMTAKDFLSDKEYSERQFYPTVQKTPPQENVYRTYGAHLDALGFNKLAQNFYNDVMSGDIPLNKVGKTTVENYVRNTAKARIDEERLAREAAKAYKRNAEATLQQRAATIPNDKTFGNAGMIELTKDTPEYDIIRTMSEDTAVLDHCVGQGGSARGSEDRNPWYGNSHRSYEPILDLVTGQPNPRATSDRTSYVTYVQNGDKIVSVRDLATGLPQATIHFEQSRIGNSGQQKYSIGYASGHQNGDIDAKYSGAIRDYLNSIADDIDSSGHNLQSHAGVFDMYDGDFLNAMRKELNISKQELSKYDLENMLPRFMTVSDARAAIKAANLANAEPAKAELIELNAAIEDAMQEHADLMRMARRRPMDEADREHVAELEANINTLRQRIRDLEQLTPDNAAAVAGALMAEPEPDLFANAPAARAPEEFDPETFLSNYIEDARRTMPNDDLIRVTHEVENIAQFLNMRDNTAEFATRLREAGDRAQSEITELTLYDLADQLETRMAEQNARQPRGADLDNQRNDAIIQLENSLNDPELNPDDLRMMANGLSNPVDQTANSPWISLTDTERREYALALRERANYMEFSPADFAIRLSNEAGMDIPELRDTVQALNEGNFDHEILRGLPAIERDRAAQRTALNLNHILQGMQDDANRAPATQQLAQRDPVRDTVRNADIQVLLDALTTTERARVSAAVDQALLSNNSFEGEEGLSTARRLAQLIREYPIGFVENMMQVERELVARGIDAIADARELGIGNPPPEVTPADQTDANMIATTLDESYYQDADSPQQALAQVNHHLLMLRDRPTAAFDAILGMASNDFTYSPALIQALIAELTVLSERYRLRAIGGNADGGLVRGYQAGGSVKKPDVKTPWLFSVPTYSETVAYEMYPGQKGQDDQRDAARHMLAAGTLSRKYGPGVAEFLGKAHEFTTSPLQAVKTLFGGQMPADYGMDTHNNAVGAQLGQRAKSQAELEDLVQAEAERASRTQTQGQAFIKKANGGIVQQNPTTDQMRYALMMRRK